MCILQLDRERTNIMDIRKTNLPDWSALIPVLPEAGTRAGALYDALRRLIETGGVPSGTKLPPTRDLMRRLKLSRAAAVAAYERLTAEGFTEARVGDGTYVAAAVPRMGEGQADMPKRALLPVRDRGPLALGVATPDPVTFAQFRKLLAQDLARPPLHLFNYGDPRGGVELRQAIADYLSTARGVRCSAEEIIVTAGTQQGLDLVLRAATSPGETVLVEDPCYPSALAAVRQAGGVAMGVPVDEHGMDPERIPAAGEAAKAVYITPSHQFPLGVTMTMRRRLALIERARASGAILIEDDYDSEFRYAGPPLAALQGMDDSGTVAYLGTFSKVLFPGLRTGYAVLPERIFERVIALRKTSDRQPPGLAERALARLISEGHFARHIKRARRRAEAARDHLVYELQAACGARIRLAPPEQGLHLVVRFATDDPQRATALEATCARETGLRPLSPMYLAGPRDYGLVLGFSGFAEEDFRKAAQALGRALDAYSP